MSSTLPVKSYFFALFSRQFDATACHSRSPENQSSAVHDARRFCSDFQCDWASSSSPQSVLSSCVVCEFQDIILGCGDHTSGFCSRGLLRFANLCIFVLARSWNGEGGGHTPSRLGTLRARMPLRRFIAERSGRYRIGRVSSSTPQEFEQPHTSS